MVRVLDAMGKQVGVLPIGEAINKARELEIDLVEIAPKAEPPVVKLIEYSKFKYLENKKHQEERKKQKNVEEKEVRLSPMIGEHDLEVRLAQARQFLNEGNPIKITLPFKGRMITRKEFGFEVMDRFLQSIQAIKIVREPKMEGRVLVTHIVRDKSIKRD